MVVTKLILNLIELGFSEYEAKAYAALMENNPSTGYEIAKISGIPSSKIYEVISRLKEKGVILLLNEKGKKKYIPIKPEEFIKSRRNKTEKTLKEIEEDLKGISCQSKLSYIWNINDYKLFIDKAERIIQEATKTILLSTWNEEFEKIHKVLSVSETRGVKISIIHFGDIKIKTGLVFQHPIEDTLYSEKGGRGFVIVADSKEALMSTISDNNIIEGAWSMSSGFVTLAEDYIKHDIYIMKIVNRFGKLLIKKFGINYKKLRDVFSDTEEK